MTDTAPTLDPQTQLSLILNLYAALQYREQCPNCGGKGYDVTWIGDSDSGDVCYEPCGCSNEAYETLERYAKHFEAAVDEYLRPENREQIELTETAGFLIDEVLEQRSVAQ